MNPNALSILRERYLARNAEGTVTERPEGMFTRVARFVAGAENRYEAGAAGEAAEKFYEMMASLEFLPNSPTLMNAGRDLGQLAACFVLPVEDTLDSIFDSVKKAAIIHQTGGGTGFSFSRLRPKDDVVSSTSGVASGPVSFMKVFNMATEAVKQGGARRGANMGVLRVDHPDIEEFILIKRKPDELANFNLSVALTDRFMEAYEHDRSFSLINPRTHGSKTTVTARDLLGARRFRLALGRAGRPLYRCHKQGRSHGPGRCDRGHEPLRRAASSALRILLPGFDQPFPRGQGRAHRLGAIEGARPPRRKVP